MGRLSIIGEMAGGMAHEINNPLTVVKGTITIIERILREQKNEALNQVLINNFKKIHSHIERMTRIISSFKYFSRKGNDQIAEMVSIKKIFTTINDMCFEKIQSNQVTLTVDTLDYELKCNSIQIEQVLINLVSNAIDAIASNNEKWVKLEAIKVNGFLEISVTDSGNGIPNNIAQSMMQPFFTTKEAGNGTGLGLSISLGLVESHGGKLFLDSTSKNTRFVVQLPINESSLIDLINIDESISIHLAWKQKLIHQLHDDYSSINCETIGSDKQCIAGKWIERIQYRFKDNLHFSQLKLAHSEFHQCAGALIRHAQESNIILTEAELGPGSEYDHQSNRVVAALLAFKKEIQK